MVICRSMEIGQFFDWVERESGKTSYRICKDSKLSMSGYYNMKARDVKRIDLIALKRIRDASGIDKKKFAQKFCQYLSKHIES